MSRAFSTRQIMLPKTISVLVLQSSPRTSAIVCNSCFSNFLTTVVRCFISSSISISKQLPLSVFSFFMLGCSPSLSIFLLEKKATSFSSTVSKLASDPSSERSFCEFLSVSEVDTDSSLLGSDCPFFWIPLYFLVFCLCRVAQYTKQGTTYSLYGTILVCARTLLLL